MPTNNHEKTIRIDPEQLPDDLQPNCIFPRIVSLMTYKDLSKPPDEEILNVICKRRFCFDKHCRFKDIVNISE